VGLTWEFVPVKMRERIANGVDRGARGRVLVERDGVGLVVWVPGHRYWRSRLETNAYAPAALEFESARDLSRDETLYEGGRLSRSVLVACSYEASYLLGRDVHRSDAESWLRAAHKRRCTVVVKGGDPGDIRPRLKRLQKTDPTT
jgi:hypothetical protein